MDSIWAVRLVTAVEAVRRKRKAAVRLQVGLVDDGIGDHGGEGTRKDSRSTLIVGL